MPFLSLFRSKKRRQHASSSRSQPRGLHPGQPLSSISSSYEQQYSNRTKRAPMNPHGQDKVYVHGELRHKDLENHPCNRPALPPRPKVAPAPKVTTMETHDLYFLIESDHLQDTVTPTEDSASSVESQLSTPASSILETIPNNAAQSRAFVFTLREQAQVDVPKFKISRSFNFQSSGKRLDGFISRRVHQIQRHSRRVIFPAKLTG